MDYCSYFIKDKALFGSYPSPKNVKELESNDVRYFIDLTCEDEMINERYSTVYEHINYPIVDRKVPIDIVSFTLFLRRVIKIIKTLQEDEKVYVHCRGGHGRAGLVVACLLCAYEEYSGEQALMMTNEFHSKRKIMNEKWREKGSPQTRQQKNFVLKFFEPLLYYKAFKKGPAVGFSNFSFHPVKTEKGVFPFSEAAFQSYKDPDNEEYIEQLKNISKPVDARRLGRKCQMRKDWDNVKLECMLHVLRLKIDQNKEIKDNLLISGMRYIFESNKNDSYWGMGDDGKGKNYLGKLLMKIREEIFLEMEKNLLSKDE